MEGTRWDRPIAQLTTHRPDLFCPPTSRPGERSARLPRRRDAPPDFGTMRPDLPSAYMPGGLMFTRLAALALVSCSCLSLSGCMSLWPFGHSNDSVISTGPPPMLTSTRPGNDPAIHILIPKPVAK